MMGKCSRSDSEHGMVVGLVVSISETADLLAFPYTIISGVRTEWCKRKNTSWMQVRLDRKTMLVRQVRGERPDWFELTGRC